MLLDMFITEDKIKETNVISKCLMCISKVKVDLRCNLFISRPIKCFSEISSWDGATNSTCTVHASVAFEQHDFGTV